MAELHISTGIDTSPLVNGLNDIRSELKKTAKAIDELSGKFDKLPNAEERTEGLASANKKLSEAAMQCADEIAKLREEHDRATMSIDEAQKELEEEERIMKKYGVTASEVTEALQKRGDVEEKGTSSTSKSSKATKDASVSNKEAAASINEMASAASSLPGPVGQAASSVASLTSMVSKLMSSGWLWFLGAVAAAYEYLTWSMSRTVEGQEQLDLVTSKYKQRLENLKDAASAAGRSLFSAFDHAAGAVERFLGKVDSVFESLSKLGGGAVGDFLSFIGGKVGIVSKMSRAALGWVWNRNTDEAASLQDRENNQWQKKNKFIVEEARLQKEINEERAKAYDYSLKESERAAAIKKATELTNKLYDQKVAIAREDAEIAKERAKLSDTDKATADAVQKAEAEALNIESQRANQLRFLKRMEGRFNKPDKSGASAAAEMKKELQQADALFQQQLEQLERQEKELQDRKNAQEEARISAIEDDGARERAEEKHQHELRLQQIKQQADAMRKANYEADKKAYEAANPGKKYSQTKKGSRGWAGTSLTADQEATIKAQLDKANAEEIRLMKERARALIREHQSYVQKKQQIDKDYADKVKQFNESIVEAEKAGDKESVKNLQMSLAEAARDRAKAQADLSFRQLQEMPEYTRAFEDLNNTSTETLQYLIGEFERVKESAGRNLDPQDLKQYTDAIEQMQEAIRSRNPFKSMAEAVKKYDEALANTKAAKAALKETSEALEKAKSDAHAAGIAATNAVPGTKKYEQSVKDLKEAKDKLNEAEKKHTEASKKVRKAQDEQTGAGNKLNKTISETLNSVSQLNGSLREVGNVIGGVEGEIIGFITEVVDVVVQSIEQIESVAEAASNALRGLDEASIILTLITLGIKMMQKFNSLYEGYTEEIKELQKEIYTATKAVDEYGLAVIRARQAQEEWFNAKGYQKMLSELQASSGIVDLYRNAIEKEVVGYMPKMAGLFNNLITEPFMNSANAIFNRKSAINNIFVETQEAKAGFLGLWGAEAQQVESVQTFLKKKTGLDLFDEEGNIDLDAYKVFMENWGDKLVGDGQAILDHLAKLQEEKNKYYEELKQYVEDLYSPLVENFTSAIWEYLDSGKDALEAFDDIASDTFKNIANEFIQSMIKLNVVEPYMEELKNLMDSVLRGDISQEAYAESVSLVVAGMKGQFYATTPAIESVVNAFKDMGLITSTVAGGVNEVNDAIDSLVSSLSDTNTTLEEWGRSFKENIIAQFMEGFLTEEDKSDITDAMQSINDIMSNTELTPDQKASAVQPYIEAIEKYVAGGKEATQQLRDAFGLTDETEEKLAKPFEDLKDDILDSLTDLENGAENFKKSMQSKMISDVIEKMVLGNKVQIQNADGSLAAFDTFNDWLEDWQQRYSDILNDATLADEDREHRLQALVDEAVEVREAEAESAEKFAEKLRKVEEAVGDTTFKDMDDSFVSALMDMDKDADAWGEEIGRTMARRIIEQLLVAKQIQPLLDTLQTAMDSAFTEKGGGISTVLGDQSVQAALAAIKDRYPELQEAVRQIMKALGLDVSKTVNSESDNPFSSLGDSLVSSLMDMDSTAESFGKQIGQTLAEQMIRNIVSNDKNKAKIDAVAQELQEAIASGDAREIEEAQRKLQELYAAIEKNVHAIRDTQKVIEDMSDTTFKDMGDAWTSALMDMDTKAEDWGKQIGKTLLTNLVKKLVVEKTLQPFLDRIQEVYNIAVAKPGATIESVMQEVTPAINDAVAAMDEVKPAIDTINEAFETVGETIQGSPLANIRSMLLSQLMDSEGDFKNFVANVNKELLENLIDKRVLYDYDERMEEWSKRMAAIEGNEDYTQEDIARETRKLQDSIEAYGEEAKVRAETWKVLMGYKTYQDQSATMNMSDKATFEQMDQYLGTNMGILMATEQGNQVRQQILATLQTMGSLTSPDNPVILEMRGLMAIGNEYLLDIKRSNREILENFGARLSSIDGKLSRL